MEDQCVQTESSELSGEESFLPTTAAKTDLRNKIDNVHYYFEVEFNFWNDR